MKRLRRKAEPLKLRYVGVGEYGEQTERPHYHLAIFGYPSCAYGRPRITKSKNCQCKPCKEMQEAWKYGATLNGTLTKDSASYVAGYVTKKMTSYSLIYNEHYADTKLQTPLTIDTTDGADTTTNTTLKRCNWEKDYFVGAQDDTQLGDEVTLPLGTEARIANDNSGAGHDFSYYNTDSAAYLKMDSTAGS